ncbi:MAG: tetratricopeptide repeat protein [Granulosicoccus sp.]
MSCLKANAAVFYVLLLMSVLSISISFADQKSAQLPGLFDELKTASDSLEASRIEAMIWQQWFVAPDADSAKLMSSISQAMEGADLAVALGYSDQLVDSHPEFAEAWNRRATLHYMLGNNAASVADIRQTISLEPRHFGAISGLGLIFLREQNFEAALEAFEKVLSISPASDSAQRSVDRVRQELGREI